MFNISNNGIITVSRGDNFTVQLFINQGTELNPIRFTIGENCEVYLGIMEPNQKFEDALIKKRYTTKSLNKNGDIVVSIKHQDTACLVPGKYFYEFKLRALNPDTNEYEVNTIIPKKEFNII